VLRSLELQLNSTSFNVTTLAYFKNDFNASLDDSSDVGPIVFNFNGEGEEELLLGMRTAVAASFSTPDVLVSNANTSSPAFAEAISHLNGAEQAARLSQRDLWRNVRIPFVHLLDGYNPAQPFAWLETNLSTVMQHDSLIGIPIRGQPPGRAGNATLLVQTTQQTLSVRPPNPKNLDRWC